MERFSSRQEILVSYKACFLVFVLILSVISLPRVSFALPEWKRPNNQPDWHACKKDSDCVYLGNACFSSAVNKRFLNRAKSFAKRTYNEMQCFQDETPPEDITVFCKRATKACRSENQAIKSGGVCFEEKGKCGFRPKSP